MLLCLGATSTGRRATTGRFQHPVLRRPRHPTHTRRVQVLCHLQPPSAPWLNSPPFQALTPSSSPLWWLWAAAQPAGLGSSRMTSPAWASCVPSSSSPSAFSSAWPSARGAVRTVEPLLGEGPRQGAKPSAILLHWMVLYISIKKRFSFSLYS